MRRTALLTGILSVALGASLVSNLQPSETQAAPAALTVPTVSASTSSSSTVRSSDLEQANRDYVRQQLARAAQVKAAAAREAAHKAHVAKVAAQKRAAARKAAAHQRAVARARAARLAAAKAAAAQRAREAAAAAARKVRVTAPVVRHTSLSAVKQYAFNKVGATQFSCLDKLWTLESGWSVTETNSSSGAYGIPQSLPGSKMASAGADWRTNPYTQIDWGLGYIHSRYGTPCAAWAHSLAHNWY
jgi:hypothetical protein